MDPATFDHFKAFPILKFFKFSHLPPQLQAISAPFQAIADDLARSLGQGQNPAEVAAGLRKLLEAKDCFIRAALP